MYSDTKSLSGIGRATAIALAEAGWSISLLARRADKLQETKQLCKDPAKVLLVEGDVAKEEDVLRLFRETIDRFGPFFLCIVAQLTGILTTCVL